jgi:hypothetical protein
MSVRDSSERALSRFDRWPGILGLAYGVLGAPMSALLMQLIAYNGVHWACGHNNVILIQLVPVLFLLLAVVGLWLAWRDWSAVGRITRAEGATVSERTRFVAISGLILSAFSVVLILAMWIPMIVFDPCQR